MSRRSAQNARYRKDAQIGSTRKSAASAKPKRDAGVAAKPAKSTGKKSSSAGAKKAVQINPDTPQFKMWRRIWLALLLVAMVLSGGSFALRNVNDTVMKIVLTLAYVCIFAAFFIDYTIIRRLRNEWQEARSGGKKKAEKVEKADAAVEKTEASDEGKAD